MLTFTIFITLHVFTGQKSVYLLQVHNYIYDGVFRYHPILYLYTHHIIPWRYLARVFYLATMTLDYCRANQLLHIILLRLRTAVRFILHSYYGLIVSPDDGGELLIQCELLLAAIIPFIILSTICTQVRRLYAPGIMPCCSLYDYIGFATRCGAQYYCMWC